jgi:hypothetical protein
MIKNSSRQKQREWEWRQRAVSYTSSEQLCLPGKLSAVWQCRKYLVRVTQFLDGTVLLSIEDAACRHSWRDMQRIKNDLLGEQWAAVEVYPPQSLVVDDANIYHLWCTPRQLRIG